MELAESWMGELGFQGGWINQTDYISPTQKTFGQGLGNANDQGYMSPGQKSENLGTREELQEHWSHLEREDTEVSLKLGDTVGNQPGRLPEETQHLERLGRTNGDPRWEI